jgi:hypothetical protein
MLDIAFVRLADLPDTVGTASGPLVVMPFIDADLARRSATQLAARADCRGTLLAVDDVARVGFATVANTVFRRSCASSIAYVAQDAFAGRGWLAQAQAALADGGGLVAFQDGKWRGALAAFGLADAGWARGNYGGDLFHPGYRRHYADVELTLLAMADGRLRHDPAAVLVEVDWGKDGQPVDTGDRALFRQRAENGFDGRVADPRLRTLFS